MVDIYHVPWYESQIYHYRSDINIWISIISLSFVSPHFGLAATLWHLSIKWFPPHVEYLCNGGHNPVCQWGIYTGFRSEASQWRCRMFKQLFQTSFCVYNVVWNCEVGRMNTVYCGGTCMTIDIAVFKCIAMMMIYNSALRPAHILSVKRTIMG